MCRFYSEPSTARRRTCGHAHASCSSLSPATCSSSRAPSPTSTSAALADIDVVEMVPGFGRAYRPAEERHACVVLPSFGNIRAASSPGNSPECCCDQAGCSVSTAWLALIHVPVDVGLTAVIHPRLTAAGQTLSLPLPEHRQTKSLTLLFRAQRDEICRGGCCASSSDGIMISLCCAHPGTRTSWRFSRSCWGGCRGGFRAAAAERAASSRGRASCATFGACASGRWRTCWWRSTTCRRLRWVHTATGGCVGPAVYGQTRFAQVPHAAWLGLPVMHVRTSSAVRGRDTSMHAGCSGLHHREGCLPVSKLHLQKLVKAHTPAGGLLDWCANFATTPLLETGSLTSFGKAPSKIGSAL